jgi:hypothetical protein
MVHSVSALTISLELSSTPKSGCIFHVVVMFDVCRIGSCCTTKGGSAHSWQCQ